MTAEGGGRSGRHAGWARAGMGRVARIALRSPLVATGALALARALARPRLTVFMLHRFHDRELGNDGHPPEALRATLALLRSQRVRCLSLAEAIAHLGSGVPLEGPAVAFTVDDGYADFASVGGPVFAEYDVPVTLFVTTDVVAGGRWFWWDRVEEAFARSPRREITLDLAGASRRIELGSPAERRQAADALVAQLKWAGDETRLRITNAIGMLCDVELPSQPPPWRATLDWDAVRAQAARGVAIGPHSRSHPVLSQVGDAAAADEIGGSWDALRAHCPEALPVFCYPNGTRASFTPRDEALVAAAGMRAAVAYDERHIDPSRVRPADHYRLSRRTLSEEPVRMALAASALIDA